MKRRLCSVFLLVCLIPACNDSDAQPEASGGQDGPGKPVVRRPSSSSDEIVSEPAVLDREEPAGEPAADEGPARKWTDSGGNALAVGEFVDLIDGKVCLEDADGAGVVISLEKLSQADREYVRSQSPEVPAEPTQPPPDLPTAVSVNDDPAEDDPTPATAASTRTILPSQRVVIPFDFVSKFDDGRYGRMVGEMIWKKLDRQGEFVIPQTMLDVRDTCQSRNLEPTPQMPVGSVRKIVEDEFGGHVGIWGSVERAPGHDWEVYDLVIKCVDFSAGSEPKVIYEKTARTNSVSEIPHLYVQQMLDALSGREPGEPPEPDPIAEKNWEKNPNLIVGDFQQGTGRVPTGWEATGAQPREPLGNKVRWMPEAGNPDNRLIRFTFDADTGDGYGVMYYSEFFPVEEGARYRFQCRWRTNGPKVKVFIKCCDEIGTTYRRESDREPSRPGRSDYVPEIGQTREVYRSQQNLKGPENTWNTQTEDFTPKHTKYTPRWGRVMLYAYLGAGVVEFDDVVLKQILPPYATGRKVPRHSLESNVTVEEMEQSHEGATESRRSRHMSGR